MRVAVVIVVNPWNLDSWLEEKKKGKFRESHFFIFWWESNKKSESTLLEPAFFIGRLSADWFRIFFIVFITKLPSLGYHFFFYKDWKLKLCNVGSQFRSPKFGIMTVFVGEGIGYFDPFFSGIFLKNSNWLSVLFTNFLFLTVNDHMFLNIWN